MDIALDNGRLGAVVTTVGGAVWRFFARRDGIETPVFRAPPPGPSRDALAAGCFPFVPFANRVRANRFRFDGQDYALAPNVAWDPHYLHGDGWTNDWRVLDQTPTSVQLGFTHPADAASPYAYAAEQWIALDGDTLSLTLTLTNRLSRPLPFGLGWHPFLPFSPGTTLQARARSFWEEDASWLPTVERPVGGDLDFSSPAAPPRRWVNTQFEGWDGRAAIRWPERGLGLDIAADPVFGRYLVFVSDTAFDPDYAYDFFCFEPMSHSIDAHHRADGGGLCHLAPGDSLGGTVRFTVIDLVPGAPA